MRLEMLSTGSNRKRIAVLMGTPSSLLNYMWYTLIVASFLHLIGAYVSYHPAIKASTWYLPAGIAIGIMSTTLWFVVAKICNNDKDLFIYGLAWDALLMAFYMLVPLLLFDVRLDWKQGVGTILVVLGLILTKL